MVNLILAKALLPNSSKSFTAIQEVYKKFTHRIDNNTTTKEEKRKREKKKKKGKREGEMKRNEIRG